MRHHVPDAEQRKAIIEKCKAKAYPQKRPRTPVPHDLDVQPDAARILDAALKHKG